MVQCGRTNMVGPVRRVKNISEPAKRPLGEGRAKLEPGGPKGPLSPKDPRVQRRCAYKSPFNGSYSLPGAPFFFLGGWRRTASPMAAFRSSSPDLVRGSSLL